MNSWRRFLLTAGLVRRPGDRSRHPYWASSKLYGGVAVLLALALAVTVVDGVEPAWDWVELVLGLLAVTVIGAAALELRREGRY